MADISSLVIEVDSSQVDASGKSMDNAAASAEKYGASVDKLKTKNSGLAGSYSGMNGDKVMAATAAETQKLLDKYDPLSAKIRTLKADFSALESAAKNGGVAMSQIAQQDAAMASLKTQIKGLEGAMTSTETAARGAAHGSSMVTRELIVMGHEAMSGNFSQMPGSFMTMLSYSASLRAAMLGIVAPIALVAGAALTYAVAVAKGEAETREFNKTLIETGNSIGLTSNKLNELSREAAEATGASMSSATTTMNEMVRAGNISTSVLGLATAAAINLERFGGQAASETVKQFSELGKEPVSASIKLNDATNFLTKSVYEQIKALHDQGLEAEAARVAQAAYAEDISAKTIELAGNLGTLEQAWHDIKEAATGAWNAMMERGRIKPIGDRIKELAAKRDEQQYDEFGRGVDDPARAAAYNNDIVKLLMKSDAEEQIAQEKKKQNLEAKAQIEFDKEHLKYLNREGQKIAELTRLEGRAKELGWTPGQLKELQDAVELKYADKSNGKAANNSESKARLASDLNDIRDAAAQKVQIEKDAESILAAERSANHVTDQQYYEEKARTIRVVADIQEDASRQAIARLQQESMAGKDAIDINRKIADEKAKIAKIEQTANTQLAINAIQAKDAVDKLAKSLEVARASAQAYLDTVQRQFDRTNAGMGKGTLARANDAQINAIEDKAIQARIRLDEQRTRGEFSKNPQEYTEKLALIQETADKEVEITRAQQEKLKEIRKDGNVGAKEALQNYTDMVADQASQWKSVTEKAFGGMEDALAEFVTTGKADFKSLADSIVKDIMRIMIRQNITGSLAGAMGGGSSGGGLLGGMFSGLFGGNSAPIATAAANTMGGDVLGNLIGLKGFAEGTDYVPKDMVAKIHQGEAVLTKSENQKRRAANDGNGSVTNVINLHMPQGTPAESRRAAGQGAREAMAAMTGAGRYR